MSSGDVGGHLRPGSGHSGTALERLIRRGQGTLASLEPLTPSRYVPAAGTLADAAAPGTAAPGTAVAGSGGLDDDILDGDAVAADAEANNDTGQVARPVPALPAVRGRRRRGRPVAPAEGWPPASTRDPADAGAPARIVTRPDTVRDAGMAGVADMVSMAGKASPAGAVTSAGAADTAGMPRAVDVVSDAATMSTRGDAASLADGGRPGSTIIGVTALAAAVPPGVAGPDTAAGAQAAGVPPVTAERGGHEITITIGHIEVRPAAPAASEPVARSLRPEFQPRMSLADFLGERGTGHR